MKPTVNIWILPQNRNMEAVEGETLLSALCREGLAVDAP